MTHSGSEAGDKPSFQHLPRGRPAAGAGRCRQERRCQSREAREGANRGRVGQGGFDASLLSSSVAAIFRRGTAISLEQLGRRRPGKHRPVKDRGKLHVHSIRGLAHREELPEAGLRTYQRESPPKGMCFGCTCLTKQNSKQASPKLHSLCRQEIDDLLCNVRPRHDSIVCDGSGLVGACRCEPATTLSSVAHAI